MYKHDKLYAVALVFSSPFLLLFRCRLLSTRVRLSCETAYFTRILIITFFFLF